MGLDSESSCEEHDAIKIETSDVEPTTDDNDSQYKQDEKTHICVYEGCNKKFSRPSKLQAHLCYHTGERAFKCEHKGCCKSYSRPQHLRRHIATSHGKESKYRIVLRCPYPDCMKELSNQQNLKKHYYRKHERKHPFTCECCDAGFTKHQHLKQHMFQHTGIPPFRCSDCDMGFIKIGDLNRHHRSHKTYTCQFADCGVVVNAWTHMRTHIKLKHPSEFSCDDCGRTFRTKSRLKIHASIHKEPHEREIFSCTYPNCPRFYFKKSNLTHHVKSSHEGKKLECSIKDCEREFYTEQKLAQHMKLHTTQRPTPRRRKKSKNKRCDAGTHKRSMAVRLSGVEVPYEIEKMLLIRDSDRVGESNDVQSSPSHVLVVVENEKTAMSVPNESLAETDKDRLSEGDVENSITMETEQAHYSNETVVLVNRSDNFVITVPTSPVREIGAEDVESREHISGNGSDRLSSQNEIILTVSFDSINETNFTSEQQNEYTDNSHSDFSKSLNSSENIAEISSISDENANISSAPDKNMNMSLNSDENLNLEETSNNTLSDLSVESCDNSSEQDEDCICVNIDDGALLQDVDAASADIIKSECVVEDTKLQPLLADDYSEREEVKKDCKEESGNSEETKLLKSSKETRLKEFPSTKLSKSNKRKIIAGNRKLLANYKKLKLAGKCGESSSTPSDEQDVTPQGEEEEESHVALDTIYREDKYIEDCLRVIDTKDEERLDGKCDQFENIFSKKEISVVKIDKNIGRILGTSPSLKKHLFFRKKHKSLDEIIHSLHSVLEIKCSCVPTSLESENGESVHSKSSQENSNALEFIRGGSKSSMFPIMGNGSNLVDLCALSKKAISERTDVETLEGGQLECVKQEEIWMMGIHLEMTIEEWLQLMKKTMEDFFPSLKLPLE